MILSRPCGLDLKGITIFRIFACFFFSFWEDVDEVKLNSNLKL